MQTDRARHSGQRQRRRILEARRLGDVEGSVLPADGVLGVGTTWRHHLVETGDAVAYFEFPDFVAHAVHDACDVIAGVYVLLEEVGDFPGWTVRAVCWR